MQLKFSTGRLGRLARGGKKGTVLAIFSFVTLAGFYWTRFPTWSGIVTRNDVLNTVGATGTMHKKVDLIAPIEYWKYNEDVFLVLADDALSAEAKLTIISGIVARHNYSQKRLGIVTIHTPPFYPWAPVALDNKRKYAAL